MPTILTIHGWRFFFYSNEGSEPIHIHCRKGNAEAKFWLDQEAFDVVEACSYSLTAAERRNVRKIIFEHFEYIEIAWNQLQEQQNG